MSHGDADVPSHKQKAANQAKTAESATPPLTKKPAPKPAAKSAVKTTPKPAVKTPAKKTASTKAAQPKATANTSVSSAPTKKATPAKKVAPAQKVAPAKKVAPERLPTAAQNAPVTADIIAVPAIDHSPDLSLGGVDAPVELPPVNEADLAIADTDAPVDPVVPVADVKVPVADTTEVETVAAEPDAPADQPEVSVVEPDAPAVEPQTVVAVVPEPVAPVVEQVVTLAAPAAETPATEVVPAPSAPTVAPKQPESIALQVTGLTKSFGGQRVVDAIDMTVPAGTFYGIVGPNGAGKTTTLSMIAGLLKADEGTIVVNATNAQRDPRAARRLIGVLPDRLRTFDRLTGKQLLSYFGALRGLPSRTIDQRVADLAQAFDLTEALGRVVSDYSAGMTKKIMMAGALIHSPRLLILDEPFESVDPVSSTVILDILTAYVNNGGTVILSSHGMDLVERVCSRLAVIVAGQVLAEGTIEDVRGGVTLEQRFVELSGGVSDAEGLEWLHTYSA